MKWFQKQAQIHLDTPGEIQYWANRWGITPRQLKDAIINTGSINLLELREYLKQKGVFSTTTAWLRSFAVKKQFPENNNVPG
jgi:hypothetical protein